MKIDTTIFPNSSLVIKTPESSKLTCSKKTNNGKIHILQRIFINLETKKIVVIYLDLFLAKTHVILNQLKIITQIKRII